MSLPFFSKKPRIRTILQNEQEECGLACMAMIANAFGHNVDLPYMRSLHMIYKGGMSLAEMVNLAGLMGIDARGLAIQTLDDLESIKLPAVIHWESRHYIVLEKIKGDTYILQDPAVGRREFKRADFERHFSGVALEFEPRLEMKTVASSSEGLTLWDIIKSSSGFKESFSKILSVSVTIGLLTLATPILLQVSLDFVLPQADLDLLAMVAIGLCALMIFDGLGKWLRDMIILRTSIGMQVQFSRSVVSHAFRLPLRFFEARHSGDFVTRLSSIDQVKAFAADGLIRSLADAAVSIISVVLMFYYSVPMTFMVLVTLALAVLTRTAYLRRTREATTESLTAKSDEVSTLLDGLGRIQIIKAHNISARFEQRWYEKIATYAGKDFVSRRLQVDNHLLVTIVVVLGTVATLYVGVMSVMLNQMTIGMLYAFFALRNSFFLMADNLTDNLMHLTVISSHVKRLEDVIEQEPEDLKHGAVVRKAIRKGVEIRDVAISFNNDDRPVVRSANLTIDVEGSEKIAIIGESGSGKSSLLKVIASIANPTSGSVLVDGQSMARFGMMEYRSNIGAVFAEDGLFTATIAENVSLFDPEVPIERILDALHLVGLDSEIEALPQGAATIVADTNSLLSTGQRRRVLAARVICRRPRLMLFDEITANLDKATEEALLAVLCTLPGGKVFVTHSDRLLKYVDKAYRLKDGVLSLVDPEEYGVPTKPVAASHSLEPRPETHSQTPHLSASVAEPASAPEPAWVAEAANVEVASQPEQVQAPQIAASNQGPASNHMHGVEQAAPMPAPMPATVQKAAPALSAWDIPLKPDVPQAAPSQAVPSQTIPQDVSQVSSQTVPQSVQERSAQAYAGREGAAQEQSPAYAEPRIGDDRSSVLASEQRDDPAAISHGEIPYAGQEQGQVARAVSEQGGYHRALEPEQVPELAPVDLAAPAQSHAPQQRDYAQSPGSSDRQDPFYAAETADPDVMSGGEDRVRPVERRIHTGPRVNTGSHRRTDRPQPEALSVQERVARAMKKRQMAEKSQQ